MRHWLFERDWPGASRSHKWLALLAACQVNMSSFVRYQPSSRITDACAKYFLQSHDCDNASRFTGGCVPGNGRIHLPQQLGARIRINQPAGVASDQLGRHAGSFCSPTASTRTIRDAKHNPWSVAYDHTAILILWISSNC